MKKNLTITTATAASLLALQGCSTSDDWDDNVYASRDTQVCVDDAGNRVFDINCRSSGAHAGGGYYHSYYVPRSGRVPYYGDSVYDPSVRGSYTPQPGLNYASAPAGANMTRSQAVSRGGLGARGRSFGGGRS